MIPRFVPFLQSCPPSNSSHRPKMGSCPLAMQQLSCYQSSRDLYVLWPLLVSVNHRGHLTPFRNLVEASCAHQAPDIWPCFLYFTNSPRYFHTSKLSFCLCTGKYRTGKSYILNKLTKSQEQDTSFAVSSETQACTKVRVLFALQHAKSSRNPEPFYRASGCGVSL